jgi:hypothetical protein
VPKQLGISRVVLSSMELVSMKAGLEINVERTKYVLLSRHQNIS